MELKAGWTTRLLLAAPAIHLSLCYYYLFLRSFGFGSNLSEFVAAGDVFTVGLSKLILTYIIFLLGAVFGHLWVDADPLQVSGRTEVNLHPSLDRPGMRFVFNSIPYVTILGLAITLFDRKSVVLMLLPLIVIPFLARFAHAVSARNGYSYVIRTALIMFPIGIMNLTASAYGEGFRYRNRITVTVTEFPSVHYVRLR